MLLQKKYYTASRSAVRLECRTAKVDSTLDKDLNEKQKISSSDMVEVGGKSVKSAHHV